MGIALNVLNMAALFELGLTSCRMFVEACYLASLKRRNELVFDSKGFVARLADDWRVNDSDRFRQLKLVAKLVVNVD